MNAFELLAAIDRSDPIARFYLARLLLEHAPCTPDQLVSLLPHLTLASDFGRVIDHPNADCQVWAAICESVSGLATVKHALRRAADAGCNTQQATAAALTNPSRDVRIAVARMLAQ